MYLCIRVVLYLVIVWLCGVDVLVCWRINGWFGDVLVCGVI